MVSDQETYFAHSLLEVVQFLNNQGELPLAKDMTAQSAVDFSEVLEEIMARRQRKDIKSEINIVPFLDVLLVLVLIFMATAPIISQSVQVELPDSVQSQNVSNEDKTPVILEVAGVGQYSISIGGQRQEGLNEEW